MDLPAVNGAIGATARVLGCPDLGRESIRILYRSGNLVLHFVPLEVVAKVTHGVDRPALDRQLELMASQHLRAAGVPCIAPSPLMPARVHQEDSFQITFWEYFDGKSVAQPERKRARDLVRRLHLGLASFRYDSLPHFQSRLGAAATDLIDSASETSGLPERDRLYLLRVIELLKATLAGPNTQVGVIHGDCRPDNLLWNERGEARWIDFEAICVGPIAWDYANFFHPRDEYLRPHAKTIGLLADIATICAAARCWKKKSRNLAMERLVIEHLRRLKGKHPEV